LEAAHDRIKYLEEKNKKINLEKLEEAENFAKVISNSKNMIIDMIDAKDLVSPGSGGAGDSLTNKTM
jgi:hypothetical protein